MNLTWQKVSAIVTIITVVGGSSFAIERYFAKQKPHEELVAIVAKADKKYASIEDLLAMNKRITLNSLEDTLYKSLQRLWILEDRYKVTRDVDLLRDIEKLKDKIKILKQKIYKMETN
jgi:anti-sigma-K factor RskA